ncbi:uncharacterized protein LOC114452117 isoform X2 [Parambassis ranga]|nr:uncharacterized protein LOC114452117 isoform X2 [Parambassis ranga]
MQHCDLRTAVGRFPNFTSKAGSAFIFRLPVPANQGHVQHYQLSLAEVDGPLPHWMVFQQQTHSLAGLALPVDCGTYQLKVSNTEEDCVGHFYLHILNRMVTDEKNICPKGEMTIWANLLLQLNLVTLNATQRLRLVTTMAEYLRLHHSSVSLLSLRKPFILKQEKLRVCLHGVKQDAIGNSAELLWRLGCQEEGRQTDLAKVLEHSMKAGSLETLVGAPIVGWRVLCPASERQHKIKREKLTPTPNTAQPPTQAQLLHKNLLPLKLELDENMSRVWGKQEPTHTQDIRGNPGISCHMHPEMPDTLLKTNYMQHMCIFSNIYPHRAGVHNGVNVAQYLLLYNSHCHMKQTLALNKSPGCTKQQSVDTFCTVRQPDSIPSLSLTLAPHSVTSMLTREAVDREVFTTHHTLRPHQEETPLWTESNRADHSDSEGQSTVSSQGHIQDHNNAHSSLHNLPSVSHPLSAESDPQLKTLQSLPSSIKLLPAPPDVSPYLMTEPVTQSSDTIQNLPFFPSLMIHEDSSLTTLMGHMTMSELESSLSASFLYSLKPSGTIFTPALPSELEAPQLTNPVYTVESLSSSLIPLLQTFYMSSLGDVRASSYFDLKPEHVQTERTSFMMEIDSFLLTYLTLSHHLPTPTESISVPSVDSMWSVEPIQTLLPGKSLQTDGFSHVSFFVKPTLLSTHPPFLTTLTFTPASDGHFNPAAPSTVQEPHTAPFTLESSFPICGKSVAQDVSSCTPPIGSTSSWNIVQETLAFLSSYSHDETDFYTFLMFDSSRRFFSTVECLSLWPSSILPGDDLETHTTSSTVKTFNQTVDRSSIAIYTSITTSSFAWKEHCVSLEKSLLICQSSAVDSKLIITKGLPTLQISSKSTSLLTSLQAVGFTSYKSSVQSSASISSSLNLPPGVSQSVPALMATVGFPFLFSIPPRTFVDPEDGEADALSLTLHLIDGLPVSVGNWLSLDGLELHGVPLEVDLQFAPQDLLLVARDSQNLSTSLPLNLDLHRSPVDPCHVFTLTAQCSLNFMLRHRHSVELLLRKLSSFFNSSSSDHHLSVVSMTAGSTVVSWYNYSLCEISQIRTAHCHIDQIQSMWLAMSSADGSLNPAFREAMLPEFTISKVGSVRFAHDCLSTSTPLHLTTLAPHLSTNTSLSPTCVSASPPVTLTSQKMDSYQWIAMALLVVCLLILIVLVVAVVLYFCRIQRRSGTVAIWPAGQLVSVQSRDLTAVRPRWPPRLHPELPPPPLRLWIGVSHNEKWQHMSGYEQKFPDKTLQPRHPLY